MPTKLKFPGSAILAAAIAAGLASAAMAQTPPQPYQPVVAVFDGANSVAFPATQGLNVKDLATLEFWVSPRWKGKLGYDPFLISYVGPAGSRFSVAMSEDQKAIGIVAGEESDFVDFDFSDGRMHHVAFVFGPDTADVFVNGAFVDTLGLTIADVPATAFVLGSINGRDMAFKGGLADVRLWSTALDPETIAAWRLADPMRPNARHPNVNSLVGRSDFTNGRRGFSLADPPLGVEPAALLQDAKALTNQFAPQAKETAQ